MVLNGKVNILFLNSVEIYPHLLLIHVNNGNYRAILDERESFEKKKSPISVVINGFVSIFADTKKMYNNS
jgi:hypothetical protein